MTEMMCRAEGVFPYHYCLSRYRKSGYHAGAGISFHRGGPAITDDLGHMRRSCDHIPFNLITCTTPPFDLHRLPYRTFIESFIGYRHVPINYRHVLATCGTVFES